MVGGAASVDTKCRPLTIALEVFIMRWPSRFDDVANGKSLVQGQLVLNFDRLAIFSEPWSGRLLRTRPALVQFGM